MKKNIIGLFVVVLSLVQFGYTQTASANTLKTIQQEQEQKQEKINALQTEVNTVLEEVSVLSQELTELEQEIGYTEVEIEETEKEVSEQEEVVQARLEQARQRVKSLQVNEVNQNIVLTILEAESLSDLFNRAIVIMRLTDAGNQQIESAEEEVQKLADLKEKLVVTREELEGQQETVVARKESFDEKVSSLQALIQENQSELTQLVQKEEAEVARIEEARRLAREAAAKASSEAEVATASSNRESSESAQKNQTKTTQKTADQPAAKKEAKPAAKQSSGKSFTVQATGYSTKQPNLSSHTATGIDLRVNSRVIAVDPSIIPLGSMVEVEGMGVYIAGDTGGAIRGNIIDIHFETVAQALNWGRRNVKVTILN